MTTDSLLTIPPKTPLMAVEWLGNGNWAVWMHTNGKELQKPHNERKGTYLYLRNDGVAIRTTQDGDDYYAIRVFPSDGIANYDDK